MTYSTYSAYTFQVADTESQLTAWASTVTKLRSKYDWLLFFSVPKQLLLYQLIHKWDEENTEECVDMIVKEVMFLVTNDPMTRQELRERIEVTEYTHCAVWRILTNLILGS